MGRRYIEKFQSPDGEVVVCDETAETPGVIATGFNPLTGKWWFATTLTKAWGATISLFQSPDGEVVVCDAC